jgi:hypothetical protein
VPKLSGSSLVVITLSGICGMTKQNAERRTRRVSLDGDRNEEEWWDAVRSYEPAITSRS